MKEVKVLIIGGGPAGISAAIWCQRLGLSHLLLEGRSILGGQLQEIQNKIIDYPGIIVKNGQELQESFVNHITIHECSYLLNSVCLSIDFEKNIAVYKEKGNNHKVKFAFLIIANGASQKLLGIRGEKTRGKNNSTSINNHLYENKKIAVVGGGDRAIEGALNLVQSGAFVHLIHRSTKFRARKDLLNLVLNHKHIAVHTNATVKEIVEKAEKVTSIVMEKQDKTLNIPVDDVFIRIGVKPNSELVRDTVLVDENGFIVVNEFGQTNLSNIFAIGDVCTSPEYSSISSSVGQGMLAVKRIANLDK